jgi:hypothetical protein
MIINSDTNCDTLIWPAVIKPPKGEALDDDVLLLVPLLVRLARAEVNSDDEVDDVLDVVMLAPQ